MSKKIVAMLMAVAMAFSLLPVTAFATDGPSATTTKDVVDGYYNYNDNDEGKWTSGKLENAIPEPLKDTVTTVNKTAEKVADQDNQYEVTLKVEMKHKTTEVPPGAAATVLVIDTSASMEKDTKCNKKEHVHDSNCYTWEECTQENHPNHYWWDYWTKEYKHIWPTSCTWDRDGNRYVYQRLICDKEEHRHGRNCETTSRIAAAKVAARNFLNSYRGGTVSEDGTWTHSATPLERYVSIVSFNKYVSKNDWVDVSTQDGYDAAIASINALSADGGTNLDAGLRMANAQLNNGTVQGMPANVVVLTDGKPTYHLKKAENQNKNSDVEIEGVKYSVKGKGNETSSATYDQTVKTAAMLQQAASVYTVCFGASNERLEAEDEPTVSEFLKTNIATQQAEGQTYAYDANDTTDLYKAFAAISSSVVSGLKTGTVTDALPNGVSCVTNGTFDENGNLTWRLDPEKATKSEPDSNDFITYTYEKKYTVEINPEAEGLNVENGYVPLNRPTKLTVQHNDSPVQIPFPIPAGKVTYSLTNFNKELVTKSDTLSFDTNVFTIPDTKDSTVTVGEDGVTLLYKITVAGNAGAKFTVIDTGATLVSPTDGSITENTANSTFSGTVDSTGTTVFYVSKHFDVTTGMTSVSNTATIVPGDNANGPDDKEKTVITTVTKPEPTTADITVNFYKDLVSEENKVNQIVMKNQTIGDEITLGDPVIDMFKPEGYNSGVQQGTVPYVVVADTNVINVLYTKKEVNPPVTLDVSRSKIASGLTKNSNGDWTTTVKLTLPTVKQKEAQSGQTIAISKGSYVIDQIGNEFTFVPELTLKVGDKTYNGTESTSDANGTTYTFGSTEYKVTYTAKNGDTPAQFTWNINEDVYAGTEVTLSYKLKLTNPKTGTYGVTDLNGDGKVDGTDTAVDPNKALYTNESATLYKDANTKLAKFPKPSVFYTVSSGSSGSHSGGSRPSLNTKDHYGYIIGYPVDYYTGQPTTDQTKKPVRPEGKITRAEVATIYFRMLTDESRTKFWSQSNSYSDVKTGDWFNNAVSTLSKAGIIAGYEDGSFRPNGYITRAEFATIAARFFDVTYNGKDLFPDISGHWAKDYINQAANKGFVNGYEDGTFKPDRNITRAEAVTLVNRTLDRHPDKNHFTKDMLVWPDNMDQTKWYYADMQEATNSHTYQMKENSDKTKYENWTKTLPIRNWEALEKAWSNANSSQGNGNVV